jgi:hypothetical protein
LYIMNGFNGYDGAPHLSGSNGFRSGRQKGAKSFISSPNLTFKVNYFGVKGLQLGLSGYGGKSQSTLYDGIDKGDATSKTMADSSVVGLTMLGIDARYTLGGLSLKGQFNYGVISNSVQYNEFAQSDLGSAIGGWYGEVGYNLFHSAEGLETELIPFVRVEQYNTHAAVEPGTELDPSFDRSDITLGLGWKLTRGAMLKADYQIFKNEASSDSKQMFNMGVAVWF